MFVVVYSYRSVIKHAGPFDSIEGATSVMQTLFAVPRPPQTVCVLSIDVTEGTVEDVTPELD